MVAAAKFATYFGLLTANLADHRPNVPDPPFRWGTYLDARGRTFTSPRWEGGKAGPNEADYVTLAEASGVVKLRPGFVLNAVRLVIRRPARVRGAWDGDPTLDVDGTVGGYDDRAGGWPVTATDPRGPIAGRFVPAEPLKFDWYLTLTDPDGLTHEVWFSVYPTAENARSRPRK
ncbi:MAG: hypothetical protein K2X82_18555 [Gemmataceae bacterium]|nr:hypothetical protein [Gemmataceae bacterium]